VGSGYRCRRCIVDDRHHRAQPNAGMVCQRRRSSAAARSRVALALRYEFAADGFRLAVEVTLGVSNHHAHSCRLRLALSVGGGRILNVRSRPVHLGLLVGHPCLRRIVGARLVHLRLEDLQIEQRALEPRGRRCHPVRHSVVESAIQPASDSGRAHELIPGARLCNASGSRYSMANSSGAAGHCFSATSGSKISVQNPHSASACWMMGLPTASQ